MIRLLYDTIIEQFENKSSNQPLFSFVVSMQNHGGYVNSDFDTQVNVTNLKGEYSDLEQYLSLVNISDRALDNLIKYFESYDEEVIVVFFGDHQPRLSDEFYDELQVSDNDIRKYIVPFMVWSNKSEQEKYIELTSLNYLLPLTFDYSGIQQTPYFQFLKDYSDNVNAINADYYVYNGEYISVNKDDDMLKEYQILQYANIFDKSIDRKYLNDR